jgi:hypothetical protein
MDEVARVSGEVRALAAGRVVQSPPVLVGRRVPRGRDDLVGVSPQFAAGGALEDDDLVAGPEVLVGDVPFGGDDVTWGMRMAGDGVGHSRGSFHDQAQGRRWEEQGSGRSPVSVTGDRRV